METIRFTLASADGLYVDLKKRWTWGDTKAMEEARASAKDERGGAVAMAQAMLERIVVTWNLKDGSGNDLAVTPENLDNYLDADDAQKIIEKAVELRGVTLEGLSDPNSKTAS